MKNSLILLLLSIVAFNSMSCLGCNFGTESCWVDYNITLGFESDPPMKDISVGDTFRIRMEIPHLVEDTETGVSYDFSEIAAYSKEFTLSLLDTTKRTYVYAPLESFGFIEIENMGSIRLNPKAAVAVIRMDTLEESNIISFDLVANKPGLYWGKLDFNDYELEEGSRHLRYHQLNLTDTCCTERIKMVHEYTSIENQNKDLIPDLKQWGYVGDGSKEPRKRFDLDDPDIEKRGSFYFRVVE